MFKNDKPIENASQDLLETKSFASAIGNAILSYKKTDSLSIGMYGPWGSGKTSIINMVLENIVLKTKNNKNNKPIIMKFCPWNFSDQNQLISQFFKQLSSILNRKEYSGEAKEIGKKLNLYSKLLAPLALVPQISIFALILSKVFKSVGEATTSFGKTGIDTLENTKNELNILLEKQKQKIIVIIDDIDRLNNTEIRQIFQLVKSLGNFSNTIYLLAFDRNVVINALSKVQQGDGGDYLEKIVQVPFELPATSMHHIEKYLFNQLDLLLKNIPESRFDKTYWGNVYLGGLKSLFKNIRDVNRYINILQFGFELIKDEVNPIDFFAITGIQVFLPELYYDIRDNNDIFAGVLYEYSLYGNSEKEKKQLEIRCNKILEKVKNISKEDLKDFLKIIFPNIETIYENTIYGSDWLENWRKNRRICSPEVFDIYFRLSIAPDKISITEIESTLKFSNNVTDFSNALQNLIKKGKIIQFLERLEDYTKTEIPLDNIEYIIMVLMDKGDQFPKGANSFISIGTPMRIIRIFYQLSHRFDDQKKRFEIFRNAIEKAQNSLFIAVFEVSMQADQHSENNTNKAIEPEERRTVSSEQLIELEKIVCKKIEEWADDDMLSIQENLILILSSWKKWGGEEKANSFVLNLIKKNDGLVMFLTKLLTEIQSYGISDKVSKTKGKMNLKTVSEFLDVDEIEIRIRKIKESENLIDYSEKEIRSIKEFLNAFDKNVDGKLNE